MLASTHRQKVHVITETTQDIEVLVICSHTDQLVPAPLAAYELQHQKGLAEATGNTKGMRLGSAGSPSRALLRLAVDVADTIRPKDIDGPNVCAPVTQFDEERFRHFIQQHCTVHVHYFETNRSPRSSTSDRLTSSSRRRNIAVLTDHMTQAQRETLATEIRNRVAAAQSNDKRILDLSFFTKNPKANARGNEYLRSSVPNVSDIQTVTQMQSDYLQKCKNPYNFSKAEMMLDEAQQVRNDKYSERQEAAMKGLGPAGAFEMRSNVHLKSGSSTPRLVEPTSATRKESQGGNQKTNPTMPTQQGGTLPSQAPRAAHPDDSSDSDNDFTIPPSIANSPAFLKAISGGSKGRKATSPTALTRSIKGKDDTVMSGSLSASAKRGVATTDLQQKLAKAESVYAKEIAKASIAIIAEDMRRRGMATTSPRGRSPLRVRDTLLSTNSSFAGSEGGPSFLPTLVDPNCALVMGQISAFTKGRFDKRTGAYIGGNTVLSKFAGAEGADHAATGRRRSLFMKGSENQTKAESTDPSIENNGQSSKDDNGKRVAKGQSSTEAPKHAKFLYSRTGFSGSVGTATSHSSNILTNIYLFNTLFEQVNGFESLASPSVLGDSAVTKGSVVRVGPARANAGSLGDPSYPLTPNTKKALLNRLLDIYHSSVVLGTLQHSTDLAALLEANEVGGKAGATGALSNISTAVADLSLTDYLISMLSPSPLNFARVTEGRQVSKQKQPKPNSSEGATTLAGANSNSSTNKSARSWLLTESSANMLSSATLRLSPRKAEELSDSIDKFAVKGPQASILEEVERRGSTIPSPRRPNTDKPALSPLRQHLRDAANGKDSVAPTLAAEAPNTTRIPKPPSSSNIPLASGASTPQAQSLGASINSAYNMQPLLTVNSPRIPYSSSYPEHMIATIIDRAASAGGRKRVAKVLDGPAEALASGGGRQQFDADTVAIAKPFDQFFRIFDPELVGVVRRDGFILALASSAAAHHDSTLYPDADKVGGRRTSPNNISTPIHRHAKSGLYYAALWGIAVLFQQPATSDEVKLGELFALRDCLRNIYLREQRLIESDKALQRLNQAIKLLTPREGGGGGDSPAQKVAAGTESSSRALATISTSINLESKGAIQGPSRSNIPNVLLCLERAAEHGIDSHQLVSYGELGRALTEALAADGY